MSLGLLNWLWGEKTLYPVIDKLYLREEKDTHFMDNTRCSLLVTYKGEWFGLLESFRCIPKETLDASWDESWIEISENSPHLNSPMLILGDFYDEDDYPQIFEMSDKEFEDNFYHFQSEGWWVCRDAGLVKELVKSLTTKYPRLMKEYADCQMRHCYGQMKIAELKELLKAAGKSVAGKKRELIERLLSTEEKP